MKTIRIGILGCADIAERILIPAIQSMREFELIAVASRSICRAQEFSRKFSCIPVETYADLLGRQDIDAVYIPLPNSLHYTWIKQALLCGKHVLAEKPLAIDDNEAKELVGLADRSHLVLFENFAFKYHSQFKFLQKMIFDGELGDIRFISCSFGFPVINVHNNIRTKADLAGGALLDAGVYPLHASLLLLGKNLEVVGTRLKMDTSHNVDWWGSVLLASTNDIMSQIAFSFDNYYQNKIEIWGSKAKISLLRAFTAKSDYTPKVIIEHQNKCDELLLPPDNQYVNLLKIFYNSIISGCYDSQYTDILDQANLITKVRANGKHE